MKTQARYGIAANFRPWTAAEDDVVRSRYLSERATELARELGRTKVSLFKRAHRLGLKKWRPWSEHDEKVLVRQWGHATMDQIARRLGRTVDAVHFHARAIGLETGASQGREYLTHAAKRTGFCTSQLRAILRNAGVDLIRTMSRPTGAGERRTFYGGLGAAPTVQPAPVLPVTTTTIVDVFDFTPTVRFCRPVESDIEEFGRKGRELLAKRREWTRLALFEQQQAERRVQLRRGSKPRRAPRRRARICSASSRWRGLNV